MSIELHCESCGKLVRAPRDTAGRQGKCPYCGQRIYIPSPPEELEELPLAPEDEAEIEREAALQAERRRLDRVLAEQTEAAETPAGDRGSSGTGAPGSGVRERSGGPTTITLEEGVVAYLTAMRDSDLPRAERFLSLLKRHPTETRALIDRLAADQLPPSALAQVPPLVYQGFLKSLRSNL